MGAFVFTDPRTGVKYSGPDASARWAAYVQGKPFADKGVERPSPLGPPPVGTYDPAIDYNADATQRGYDQTRDDAATAYEQGSQDHGLNLADLLTGKTRGLADNATGRARLNEDYGTATAELGRQYGILGGQQAEHAAQQGITSQGLLGKSASVRADNQARDQHGLDVTHTRGIDDSQTQENRISQNYDRGVLGENLGFARTFGGYGGNTIMNPLTGQPAFGSVLTGLTRAAGENNAFQIFSGGQRASQAAANGFTPPTGLLQSADATAEFVRKQKAKAKGLIT